MLLTTHKGGISDRPNRGRFGPALTALFGRPPQRYSSPRWYADSGRDPAQSQRTVRMSPLDTFMWTERMSPWSSLDA